MNLKLSYYRHSKEFRQWLILSKYDLAIVAMDLAMQFNTGFRKDGINPAFSHQLEIASLLRWLPYTGDREALIIIGLLHDAVEDGYITIREVRRLFGTEIAFSIHLLSRTGKTLEEYYEMMPYCCNAALTKGVDRTQNYQTMENVWNDNKQARYVREGTRYILPMLRKSASFYVDQRPAFIIVQTMLIGQIELIRHIHKARKPAVVKRTSLDNLLIFNDIGDNNMNCPPCCHKGRICEICRKVKASR